MLATDSDRIPQPGYRIPFPGTRSLPLFITPASVSASNNWLPAIGVIFQKLTRNPETDRFRPLFVQSKNVKQSQVILLALFCSWPSTTARPSQLEEIMDVEIVLRSPDGFNPERDEPKLWNTVGAIRRIVAALDETSTTQRRPRRFTKIPAEISRGRWFAKEANIQTYGA